MSGGSDDADTGGRLLLISKAANGTPRWACVELDAVGVREDSEIADTGGTGPSCSLSVLTGVGGLGGVTGGSGLVRGGGGGPPSSRSIGAIGTSGISAIYLATAKFNCAYLLGHYIEGGVLAKASMLCDPARW